LWQIRNIGIAEIWMACALFVLYVLVWVRTMLLPGSDRGGVAAESSNLKSCTYDEEYHLRSATLEGSGVQFQRGTTDLDKRQIFDPEPFKLYRRPNRHLAFGQDLHLGLEAPLVRLDARIAFPALLDRSGELDLLGLSTRHGAVAIDESRALSPASCNAAKKVVGRALHLAMQEDPICRNDVYIADGIRVMRKARRSMIPVSGTSSTRSGTSRYSVDQDQVHFFAPCEGIC
jgi:hypothetical protein